MVLNISGIRRMQCLWAWCPILCIEFGKVVLEINSFIAYLCTFSIHVFVFFLTKAACIIALLICGKSLLSGCALVLFQLLTWARSRSEHDLTGHQPKVNSCLTFTEIDQSIKQKYATYINIPFKVGRGHWNQLCKEINYSFAELIYWKKSTCFSESTQYS